jgi:hypothetical protein
MQRSHSRYQNEYGRLQYRVWNADVHRMLQDGLTLLLGSGRLSEAESERATKEIEVLDAIQERRQALITLIGKEKNIKKRGGPRHAYSADHQG